MNVKTKIYQIILNFIPILCMIGLIPLTKNDYILALSYIGIITLSFFIKYEKKEYVFFVFGFFIMIISEYFFISTGVETFSRTSLFNIMPIWLPLLWAYSFVAMKRAIKILSL